MTEMMKSDKKLEKPHQSFLDFIGTISVIWTDDLREILIQEMKKRPCLWDHNHPKYRDLQYAASERNEVIESFYHRTGYALNGIFKMIVRLI